MAYVEIRDLMAIFKPRMKIPASKKTLTDEQLEAIRMYDTCTIANAIETFGVRLASDGFTDATIKCVFPNQGAMLGYAATGRIQGSAIPMAGQRCYDRTDWWEVRAFHPCAPCGGFAGHE